MNYDEETIVLRDKIYIPAINVDERLVKKHYVHTMYEEKACQRCDNRPERHNYICDSCENYKGTVQTYSDTIKNGIQYIGIPIGDRLLVEKKLKLDFDDFEIVDKRVSKKFDYKITCSLEMRDYQDEAIRLWKPYRHGLIVAPPRSGKTPTALYMAVKLGMRTLYVANQHEYLTQFLEHVEKFTNLPRLQDKHGVKLYGFAKNLEEYKTLQIAVSPYQQFQSPVKGKERFDACKTQFGTLLVDEADKSGANVFASVLNKMPAKIKTGFTGTDKRKDGREKIVQQVLGPTVARISIEQMEANVIVHRLDYVRTKSKFTGRAGFVYACKFLAKHEKRTTEILDWIEKDYNNGHSVVIPVYHVDHVTNLVNAINMRLGKKVAEGFTGVSGKRGKQLRADTLERAKSGQTRIIVGIRSILQRGLNVPRWSSLYYIMPMNNEPNWKQESSRVLTPFEGKRKPIIRMFVDPFIGLSLGCFLNTYSQSMKFKHKPTDKARQIAASLHALKASGVEEMGYDVERETKSKTVKSKATREEPKKQKRKQTMGSLMRALSKKRK